jgi:hypothetical protein
VTALERRLVDLVRDPVAFCRTILRSGVDWETQVAIIRAIAKPNARVAVKGCHSSTKTYTLANLALWFYVRYPDSQVIKTAPKIDQVRINMWGEIHAALGRAVGIRFPIPNELELRDPDPKRKKHRIIGFTSRKEGEAVGWQGFHAPHMLFILDEAPGLSPAGLNAICGAIASGDGRIVMLGNPTVPGGPFYEAFGTRRQGWDAFTIDAYDTPNFDLLREMCTTAGKDKEYITELLRILPLDHPAMNHAPMSWLANPRWAKESLEEWSDKSPHWDSRVRGKFPTQAEDALISLEWLEAAKNREPVDDGGRLAAGIDVAGPGEDECVVKVRCRSSIVAERSFPEPNPRGEVAAFLAPFKPRIEELNIDSIGIGYGFALHFQDLGYPVNFVNVGEGTSDPEKFANLKAELYWGLRRRFEAGDVAGLVDENDAVPAREPFATNITRAAR